MPLHVRNVSPANVTNALRYIRFRFNQQTGVVPGTGKELRATVTETQLLLSVGDNVTFDCPSDEDIAVALSDSSIMDQVKVFDREAERVWALRDTPPILTLTIFEIMRLQQRILAALKDPSKVSQLPEPVELTTLIDAFNWLRPGVDTLMQDPIVLQVLGKSSQ